MKKSGMNGFGRSLVIGGIVGAMAVAMAVPLSLGYTALQESVLVANALSAEIADYTVELANDGSYTTSEFSDATKVAFSEDGIVRGVVKNGKVTFSGVHSGTTRALVYRGNQTIKTIDFTVTGYAIRDTETIAVGVKTYVGDTDIDRSSVKSSNNSGLKFAYDSGGNLYVKGYKIGSYFLSYMRGNGDTCQITYVVKSVGAVATQRIKVGSVVPLNLGDISVADVKKAVSSDSSVVGVKVDTEGGKFVGYSVVGKAVEDDVEVKVTLTDGREILYRFDVISNEEDYYREYVVGYDYVVGTDGLLIGEQYSNDCVDLVTEADGRVFHANSSGQTEVVLEWENGLVQRYHINVVGEGYSDSLLLGVGQQQMVAEQWGIDSIDYNADVFDISYDSKSFVICSKRTVVHGEEFVRVNFVNGNFVLYDVYTVQTVMRGVKMGGTGTIQHPSLSGERAVKIEAVCNTGDKGDAVVRYCYWNTKKGASGTSSQNDAIKVRGLQYGTAVLRVTYANGDCFDYDIRVADTVSKKTGCVVGGTYSVKCNEGNRVGKILGLYGVSNADLLVNNMGTVLYLSPRVSGQMAIEYEVYDGTTGRARRDYKILVVN